ncbi:hypothetical protein X737_21835 [Mesorhizobium sp. L48C026A00]|jgi:hypothetical protein|nr:hypothetical protein X737_21835 [Mesorhizobium sp. L48C026A00]
MINGASGRRFDLGAMLEQSICVATCAAPIMSGHRALFV